MTNISSITKSNLSLSQDRKVKHQNKERLCYCCDTLQPSVDMIRTLSLEGRGYGSDFDQSKVEIQLCTSCYSQEYEKWFDEIPIIDDHCEIYQYEENITKLIDSFIIENQEYVWNHMDGYIMDRYDWINMNQGTMTQDRYEEYHMISPLEIKAYEERFKTCHYPINIAYGDNSKGCSCVFGAIGKYNQEVSTNVSQECYKCEKYKVREHSIMELEHEDFKIFKDFVKGEIAKDKLSKMV